MDLNNYQSFASLDPEGMLAHIDGLPDQLEFAWNLGKQYPRPPYKDLQSIVISGMGGSAIGADLLSAYAAPLCPLPIYVHRDYDLPAWAKGPQTLVICSSHSGNTEETLSAFAAARATGCSILSITTGGKLASLSKQAGVPVWAFEHTGQPRAAVGFSFGLILAALFQLSLLPNPEKDLAQALQTMRDQQTTVKASVPVVNNLAKRLAGQFYDRLIVVFGSGPLAPVSRRWKGQFSEVAKAWGQFEYLPEVDHNTLAGLSNPAELLSKMMIIFLRSPSDHPRNRLRSELTRQSFMVEGFNTDFVDAKGENPMAHIWSTLLLGDYISYYLAMMYEVDPTPIPAIESFKREMKRADE